MRNIADITPYWDDIQSTADIPKLSEIAGKIKTMQKFINDLRYGDNQEEVRLWEN